MLRLRYLTLALACALFWISVPARAQPARPTATYQRIKAYLDSIPAIDTHDHLWPFQRLSTGTERKSVDAMNLYTLWKNSYYTSCNPLAKRQPGEPFDTWWPRARNDFADARATCFYRYLLPAFADLYGVDFDHITDEQARRLDQRITENYRDPKWLYQVITERANIELIFADPYWARLKMRPDYPFVVPLLNVNTLVHGFHPSECAEPDCDPYRFAKEQGLRIETLDDYVALLDRLMATAKARGVACLKHTLAYERTLQFDNVPRERAAAAFERPRSELSARQIKDFEDFIIWRLTELCARYDLPMQIHTGQARIQGSNPLLLADLIDANPNTKFILFHGGFPWVGETGAIMIRYSSHVWVDSVWLPTLSYTMARRAFQEWLEEMPSNRIRWGSDCRYAEGIYGATEMMRRCWAEALAEKVDAGALAEEHALRIGRQIFRDNALGLFPGIKAQLWKAQPRFEPRTATRPAS
jgi:predicted TIM-barrel fold metal-dependent hydrolase